MSKTKQQTTCHRHRDAVAYEQKWVPNSDPTHGAKVVLHSLKSAGVNLKAGHVVRIKHERAGIELNSGRRPAVRFDVVFGLSCGIVKRQRDASASASQHIEDDACLFVQNSDPMLVLGIAVKVVDSKCVAGHLMLTTT